MHMNETVEEESTCVECTSDDEKSNNGCDSGVHPEMRQIVMVFIFVSFVRRVNFKHT